MEDGNLEELELLRELLARQEEEMQRLQQRLRELAEAEQRAEELRQQVATDELTGLVRRGHFLREGQRRLQEARRSCRPLALLLIDIDGFKRVNDTCGHPAGDELLAQFGELLRRRTRQADLPARYGGEEFVVLLEETGRQPAIQVAERIRAGVEEHAFTTHAGERRITVSIGVAVFPEDGDCIEDLIEKADQAMYRAKAAGKNRVKG